MSILSTAIFVTDICLDTFSDLRKYKITFATRYWYYIESKRKRTLVLAGSSDP